MGTEAIQVFENQSFGRVRTVMHDGEPWFVAADVCEAFGVTNRNRLMQQLDDDEKGGTRMYTPGGMQEVAIVSEPGLYYLLFLLRPAEARGVPKETVAARVSKINAFRRWVTHEVLPSIRKTGMYAAPDMSHDADVVTALITALRHEQDLSAALQRRINWLTSPEGIELRKRGRLHPAVEELPQRGTEQFLTAVAALAAEEGRICDLHASAPAQGERLIGYEDDQHYYLIPARAYQTAEEWCAQRGTPMLLTKRALLQCLREAGTILPAVDGSTSTRVKLVNSRATRLLWLCKVQLLMTLQQIGGTNP